MINFLMVLLFWATPCTIVDLYSNQWRSKVDIWGGGTHIHIFQFTDHENNRFQKKLIVQSMYIPIYVFPPSYRVCYATDSNISYVCKCKSDIYNLWTFQTCC